MVTQLNKLKFPTSYQGIYHKNLIRWIPFVLIVIVISSLLQSCNSFQPYPTPINPSTSIPIQPITSIITFDFHNGTDLQQANFLYSPAKAYLFASGLIPGDKVEVWWKVAASILDITGDIFTVWVRSVSLPKPRLYGPVQSFSIKLFGNEVTISWEHAWMSLENDRDYLIKSNLCQKGVFIWQAVQINTPSNPFFDAAGCIKPSSTFLNVVEKLGYTDPI